MRHGFTSGGDGVSATHSCVRGAQQPEMLVYPLDPARSLLPSPPLQTADIVTQVDTELAWFSWAQPEAPRYLGRSYVA